VKVLKIEKKEELSKYVEEISDYLLNGKIVVLPTDTVFGFSCLATNENAINKIYKIKKRDKDKPFLVLVDSYCKLKDYFYVSLKQEKYLRTIWPAKSRDVGVYNPKLKPTTVILRSRGKLPKALIAGDGNGAVRLANDELIAKVIKRVGCPIVSTSLNVSGGTVVREINEIKNVFKGNLPDLVVDTGSVKKKKPSKLLDITDIGDIKIIRG